jgi:hypothetical protein
LRAVAKKITWWQAAEIIGISDRQMRRWREWFERLSPNARMVASLDRKRLGQDASGGRRS